MVDIDQTADNAVGSHMLQAQGGNGLRDRTPADYAVEHAGYLVTAANQLIEARDELDGLTLREEECGDVEDEEVEAAEQSVRDATSCLRLAIHEFEKRRNRALAATGKQQGGEVCGHSKGLPPLPEAYGEITYRRQAGYIGRVEGFTSNHS